jgi:hypothetical protein
VFFLSIFRKYWNLWSQFPPKFDKRGDRGGTPPFSFLKDPSQSREKSCADDYSARKPSILTLERAARRVPDKKRYERKGILCFVEFKSA